MSSECEHHEQHCEPSTQALVYVDKMFRGVGNTLGLENAYNDLRDNETRAARHQQRSVDVLQSLSISSMHSRYKDLIPLPEVTPEVLGKVGSVHCNRDIFDPTKHQLPKAKALDMTQIDQGGWLSTRVDMFPRTQLSLMHALMGSSAEQWADLWMVGLLRPHMLLSRIDTHEGILVLVVDKWSYSYLELDGVSPFFTLKKDKVKVCHLQPFDGLDKYLAHDYTIGIAFQDQGATLQLSSSEVFTVPKYCAKRSIHLMTTDTLRKILGHYKISMKGLRTIRQLAEEFLTLCTVFGEERESILAMVDARAKRRSKKQTTSGEAVDAGDDGEHEAFEEVEEEPVPVPAILKRLAPAEVAYMHSGVAPAGAALNEEEDDYGIEVQKTRLLEKSDRLPAKPPVEKHVAPKPSAAASSSSAPAASSSSAPCCIKLICTSGVRARRGTHSGT